MDTFLKNFQKLKAIAYQRSFALNKIDLKLKKYLNFKQGFFIEAGANDGVNQSNTLFFERYYQWQGILIEPIFQLAQRCKSNRPKCIVENCALIPFDFKNSEIEIQYCNLMSVVKGGMKSVEEEINHIKIGCNIQNITTYTIKVPAKSLTQILDKYEIKNIDFFCLDVEGFELNVLKGLDFDKYQPNWMLIEARYRDEIDAFIKPLYEPVAELSHHDVLYKNYKV